MFNRSSNKLLITESIILSAKEQLRVYLFYENFCFDEVCNIPRIQETGQIFICFQKQLCSQILILSISVSFPELHMLSFPYTTWRLYMTTQEVSGLSFHL